MKYKKAQSKRSGGNSAKGSKIGMYYRRAVGSEDFAETAGVTEVG